MSIIFDGKKEAEKITDLVKAQLSRLINPPFLEVLLVGIDPVNQSYLQQLEKTARELGINFASQKFIPDATFQTVSAFIRAKNQQEKIDGILILVSPNSDLYPQRENLVNLVDPEKDVDYLGQTFSRNQGQMPSVCEAVLQTLYFAAKALAFEPQWEKILVVGGQRGFWGKRIKQTLVNQKFESITQAGSKDNLNKLAPEADVIISCVGKPNLIKSEMVKKGATVIDLGLSQVNNKFVGDVDFSRVKKKAGFITPVPNGIGPLSTILVYKNLLERF